MRSRILNDLWLDVLLTIAFTLFLLMLVACSTEVVHEAHVPDAMVHADADLVGLDCPRADGSPEPSGDAANGAGIRADEPRVVPGQHDSGSPVVAANGEVSQEVSVCLDPCGRGGFLESPRTNACCPEGASDVACLELYSGNARNRCSCGSGRRCYLPPEELRNQLSGYCLPSQ